MKESPVFLYERNLVDGKEQTAATLTSENFKVFQIVFLLSDLLKYVILISSRTAGVLAKSAVGFLISALHTSKQFP